jgi:hypothetical protein
LKGLLRLAAQLVIRNPIGHYPQGHEYPDCFGPISASQVFSCSKYRLPAIKNQLQADPKMAGGSVDPPSKRTKLNATKMLEKRGAKRNGLHTVPTDGSPRAQRVGLCWAAPNSLSSNQDRDSFARLSNSGLLQMKPKLGKESEECRQAPSAARRRAALSEAQSRAR